MRATDLTAIENKWGWHMRFQSVCRKQSCAKVPLISSPPSLPRISQSCARTSRPWATTAWTRTRGRWTRWRTQPSRRPSKTSAPRSPSLGRPCFQKLHLLKVRAFKTIFEAPHRNRTSATYTNRCACHRTSSSLSFSLFLGLGERARARRSVKVHRWFSPRMVSSFSSNDFDALMMRESVSESKFNLDIASIIDTCLPCILDQEFFKICKKSTSLSAVKTKESYLGLKCHHVS